MLKFLQVSFQIGSQTISKNVKKMSSIIVSSSQYKKNNENAENDDDKSELEFMKNELQI